MLNLNRIIMKIRISSLFITFFLLYSCTPGTGYKKIGDADVSYLAGDLSVDNFPHYKMGISGINQMDFGSFSFDKLDEFVYKVALSEPDGRRIYITIRHTVKDRYGNTSMGRRITIGYIDPEDAKKYSDYDRWHRYNSTYRMWLKDYNEYKRRTEDEGQGRMYYISEPYEPKSIR